MSKLRGELGIPCPSFIRSLFQNMMNDIVNPVKRGLVDSPEQWRWSSFRHYLYGESGAVVVDEVFAPRWAKSIKPGTPLPTQAALVWGTTT